MTDFPVFYSQDSIVNTEITLKNEDSKIVVVHEQIVKVSKNKGGAIFWIFFS